LRKKQSPQRVYESVYIQPQSSQEPKYMGNKINQGTNVHKREAGSNKNNSGGGCGCGCNNNPKQLGIPIKKYQMNNR
jgi:hypothetical protein